MNILNPIHAFTSQISIKLSLIVNLSLALHHIDLSGPPPLWAITLSSVTDQFQYLQI